MKSVEKNHVMDGCCLPLRLFVLFRWCQLKMNKLNEDNAAMNDDAETVNDDRGMALLNDLHTLLMGVLLNNKHFVVRLIYCGNDVRVVPLPMVD